MTAKEDLTPQSFRQIVRRGPGPTAKMILEILTGERQVASPIEVSPAAFLTLCFRHDLDADEHVIFRVALLEVLNAYALGDARVTGDVIGDLTYVIQSSSLPRRRRTEVTSMLHSCIQSSEARNDRAASVAFLNVMADEVLITNIEEWQFLYRRIGADAGMPCFFGIGQLDLEEALRWLSNEFESVDYEVIRDFGLPSLLKSTRPGESSQILIRLQPEMHPRVYADLKDAYRRTYGMPLRQHRRNGSEIAKEHGSRETASSHKTEARRAAWMAKADQSDRQLSPLEQLSAVGPIADANPGDEGYFPPRLALLKEAV